MTEFTKYNRQDCRSLEEIWNHLLRVHWEYLDTEENMHKLEMRKNLESELRDFLCMVQHDRKFFLTETSHVLKQSIMKMDNFTAYKALIGFETISNYANNLFRKPWRKEYRCIKTYCGYYQHEVSANLIDAEKLFEAMGYQLMVDQTLILDGSICPDQVTNVSRDAMTAYVECQIMKQIFQGLTTMRLQTTWQEIYKFRETHIGTVPQAIAAMASAIYERNQRQKAFVPSENCYSNHVHPSISCNHYQNRHYHNHPCSSSSTMATSMSVPCNSISAKCITSIPHSKSLEHYQDPLTLVAHNHINVHRSYGDAQSASYHSNNHSYDCIDSSALPYGSGNGAYHSAHYASIDHMYGNVGGNGGYNHYAQIAPAHRPTEPHYSQVTANGCVYNMVPPVPCGPAYMNTYATIEPPRHSNTASAHYDCINDPRSVANCRVPPPATPNCRCFNATVPLTCEVHGKLTSKNFGHHQLIDFDDKANVENVMQDNGNQFQSQHYQNSNHHRRPNKYSRNGRNDFNEESKSSRASDFDSFEDTNNLNYDRDHHEMTTDNSASSKIRDGVGSYETWNYVFQNIGKGNSNPNELPLDQIDLNALKPTKATKSTSSRISGKSIHVDNNAVPIKDSVQVKKSNISTERSNGRVENVTTIKPKPQSNGTIKKSAMKSTTTTTVPPVELGNTKSKSVVIQTNNDASGASPSTVTRTAPNEWSCKFCTFLNPSNLRICQMCCKSQDFVNDVPKASTCV